MPVTAITDLQARNIMDLSAYHYITHIQSTTQPEKIPLQATAAIHEFMTRCDAEGRCSDASIDVDFVSQVWHYRRAWVDREHAEKWIELIKTLNIDIIAADVESLDD